MALFSNGGSVFDDYLTAVSYGTINLGKKKDDKRSNDKKEAGIRDESLKLRDQGLDKGDSEFEKIYGTTKDQVGLDMKDIIQRRKDALAQNSNDPVANQIRQSGNDQVRQANSSLAQNGVKGGGGAQYNMAIKRQANRDVNAQLADKYMKDLNASQSITGNLATQSQRLPQMYAQIFQGGQYIPPVGKAPFLGGILDGVLG